MYSFCLHLAHAVLNDPRHSLKWLEMQPVLKGNYHSDFELFGLNHAKTDRVRTLFRF